MSDFFYPRLGGVEMHIFCLASCLVRMGHHVIIMTHGYGGESNSADKDVKGSRCSKRTGVRYLAVDIPCNKTRASSPSSYIKVYHLPLTVMTDEDTLPTFLVSFPLLRWIWIRERIEVVHVHQATSTMANESVAYAAEMGLASVYTDHSLFGFDDLASVILNRVLKTTLCTVGASICVSYTCRENLIIRANMDSSTVHAIPNAIDASKFTPDPDMRSKDRVKVVIVSRLVYRKGVDLLVGIIPRICKQFPDVDFIIGGDGAKKLSVEEMVERERLQERVEFLGAIPHSLVRDVLVRGHIFLNCSLTESFCIAILEAASCGLFVVSTNVGGVPEVLPDDMIFMAKPSVSDLTKNLSKAIQAKLDTKIEHQRLESIDFHERIKNMYSWTNVTKRTISVYEQVLQQPKKTFLERLGRYRSVGPFAGYVASILAITLHLYVSLCQWWQSEEFIDRITTTTIDQPYHQ